MISANVISAGRSRGECVTATIRFRISGVFFIILDALFGLFFGLSAEAEKVFRIEIPRQLPGRIRCAIGP